MAEKTDVVEFALSRWITTKKPAAQATPGGVAKSGIAAGGAP